MPESSCARELGEMLNANSIGASQVNYLTELVYELLDAHQDTARLVDELAPDVCWEAHLDYLRGLQRVGREALAGLSGLQQSPV
jgi:hypothetical protein